MSIISYDFFVFYLLILSNSILMGRKPFITSLSIFLFTTPEAIIFVNVYKDLPYIALGTPRKYVPQVVASFSASKLILENTA